MLRSLLLVFWLTRLYMYLQLIVRLLVGRRSFYLALVEQALFLDALTTRFELVTVLSVTVPVQGQGPYMLDISIFCGYPVELLEVFKVHLSLVIAVTTSMELLLLHTGLASNIFSISLRGDVALCLTVFIFIIMGRDLGLKLVGHIWGVTVNEGLMSILLCNAKLPVASVLPV